MAASILDNFGQLINQGYASKVAERLGEDPQNIFRGLQAASSSILAGLANKTGDSGMMRQVFDLVSSPNEAIREIDPAAYAEQADTATGVGSISARFLSDLFGDRSSMVNDVVARASGLSLTSVSSIMRFAAPMVLGFVGRQVRSLGLDQNSLTRTFADERDNIMRAAPPGLASALGVAPSREREMPIEGARTTPEYVTHRERAPQKGGGSRWLWPTIAALAVIALFWGARSRSHRAPAYDTSTAGGVVAPSPARPESAMMPPSMAPSSGSITLPNGAVITVPAGGVESRLFAVVSSPSAAAEPTTRFDVDRIAFVRRSATLTPDSDNQLTNIAAILKAYPNATIKLVGYADTTGTAAENKHLAAQRAAAVKAVLLKKGIAARRVQSQGYGNEPGIDTSMAAGVAPGRVSIIVLHK